MSRNGVKALLMGGQACVLYGAAQFSRDVDLALWLDESNLQRLTRALEELGAEVVAVPQFQREYLERGLAVHFRCQGGDAAGMRIDVMSRMRGVAPFPELWERRVVKHWDGIEVNVMGVEDLVQAKKTQRDKDWPMIRQLLEKVYYEDSEVKQEFLFRELRTAELLIELAATAPELAGRLAAERKALAAALRQDVIGVRQLLKEEEEAEREADREYWRPLKQELEMLRRRGGVERGSLRGAQASTEAN